MTDEEVIRAYYPTALRRWRPEYGDMVRVPVQRPVPPFYRQEALIEPLNISCVEYVVQRGYFDHRPVTRVVGRYNGAEVELEMRVRR